MVFLKLLVVVHAGLVVWAVAGFAEWLLPAVPWTPISNPLFPHNILFIHWFLILAAGVTFVAGWASRWRHTPVAMAIVYSAMATLCAVETLEYLTSDWRYLAMVVEFAAYLLIAITLSRSARFARVG